MPRISTGVEGGAVCSAAPQSSREPSRKLPTTKLSPARTYSEFRLAPARWPRDRISLC
jgi:hypothetical protein